MIYVFRNGQLIEKPADEPRAAGPMIMRDCPEYRSPLGTGLITSRSHRREDLKRGNCREVDPGEWKPDPNYRARKEALKRAKAETQE